MGLYERLGTGRKGWRHGRLERRKLRSSSGRSGEVGSRIGWSWGWRGWWRWGILGVILRESDRARRNLGLRLSCQEGSLATVRWTLGLRFGRVHERRSSVVTLRGTGGPAVELAGRQCGWFGTRSLVAGLLDGQRLRLRRTTRLCFTIFLLGWSRHCLGCWRTRLQMERKIIFDDVHLLVEKSHVSETEYYIEARFPYCICQGTLAALGRRTFLHLGVATLWLFTVWKWDKAGIFLNMRLEDLTKVPTPFYQCISSISPVVWANLTKA